FAMRFQQTTGPVTAKAIEDTAFYRYTRNIAQNEVGSSPERVGLELDEFHAQNSFEQSEHKLSLTATSTHDTKRGEDARARLSMLSELPNTWRRTVFELSRSAAKYRSVLDGDGHTPSQVPARSDEYLYYQALVGALPFGAKVSAFDALGERMQAYMLKSAREAKSNTSWLNPEPEYENALARFVEGTLADREFRAPLQRFCARIDRYAACKALGQIALKLCAPGVPDSYQGSEVWHQVLVDPDNRRPVDYAALEAALASLDERQRDRAALLRELLTNFADGSLKLFVVSELLRLRRDHTELFQSGYAALDAGPDVVAFARGARAHGASPSEFVPELICAVPRFPFRITRGRMPWPLGRCFGARELAGPHLAGTYKQLFTGATITSGGSLALSDIFAEFPLAVLLRIDAERADEWLDPEQHVGELRATNSG
ncbi:MAG TPA: hypothetical protein VGI70_17760, partial [Polyangiales bacterium]